MTRRACLGVLGTVLFACGPRSAPQNAGDAHPSPAPPRPLAPDVARFQAIWAGATESCVPSDEPPLSKDPPSLLRFTCSVPGWDRVAFKTEPGGSPPKALTATSSNPNRCELASFAEKTRVVGDMEAAIMSEVSYALESGPFAGECLTLTVVFTQRQCSISLYTPVERTSDSPAAKRGGCAPY